MIFFDFKNLTVILFFLSRQKKIADRSFKGTHFSGKPNDWSASGNFFQSAFSGATEMNYYDNQEANLCFTI